MPTRGLMMDAPLFTMEEGMVRARTDVADSVPRDDEVFAWMDRMRLENPGLYVFALKHCWQTRPLLRNMKAFCQSSMKEQLRLVGLPPRRAVGRVLAKLRFAELDNEAINRLGRWLHARKELPKVLLHARQVHLRYLEALMHNEWLACLPYPADIGVHPESDEGIEQFLTLFDLFCHFAAELDLDEATLTSALGGVRTYDGFVELYERFEDKLHRQRLINDNVQVPLPLEEIEGIEAPRTLPDFERLGDLQENCIRDYFQRARGGHCAIYTVVRNGKVMLTAEIVPSKDGFWTPSEVLARGNTMPRQQDVEHLYHWLALTQARPNDADGYARNLIRLLNWVCYWTLKKEGEDGLSPFLQVEVNAASRLVADRAARGHAGQMGMAFDQPASAIRKEKG